MRVATNNYPLRNSGDAGRASKCAPAAADTATHADARPNSDAHAYPDARNYQHFDGDPNRGWNYAGASTRVAPTAHSVLGATRPDALGSTRETAVQAAARRPMGAATDDRS